MTAQELIGVIGKIGLWATGRREGVRFLRVKVKVVDARVVFGRKDYRIEPTDGEGTAWVDAGQVVMDR